MTTVNRSHGKNNHGLASAAGHKYRLWSSADVLRAYANQINSRVPLKNVDQENVRVGCQSLLHNYMLHEQILDTHVVNDAHKTTKINIFECQILHPYLAITTAAGALQTRGPC